MKKEPRHHRGSEGVGLRNEPCGGVGAGGAVTGILMRLLEETEGCGDATVCNDSVCFRLPFWGRNWESVVEKMRGNWKSKDLLEGMFK